MSDRAQSGVGGAILLLFVLIGAAGAVVGYSVFENAFLSVVGAVGGFVILPGGIIAMQLVFIGLFENVLPALFQRSARALDDGLSFLLPERIATLMRQFLGGIAIVVALVCVLFTLPITMGNMVVAILVADAFTGVAGVATYAAMTIVGLTTMAMSGM